MIRTRPSDQRGATRIAWLDGKHSFSFNRYYDPKWMGFRSLRVINEDHVAPAGGFPTHPHDNMEILTYVMQGGLKHADSMGTSSTIAAGELQRMSAGTGITHSEVNASDSEPVHLFQIWIEPAKYGLDPGYEQRAIPAAETEGKLRLVAGPEGDPGTLMIHQDARLYLAHLAAGQSVEHALAANRGAWVQVMQGEIELNGTSLKAGDGAAIEAEPRLTLTATADTQVMLFDLA